MPPLQSYAQILKHQISPMANQVLDTVFDNFSEKIKNPNSPEKKVFDTMVALVACTMQSEKLKQESNALLSYLENLNRRGEVVTKAKPIHFEDREEEEEEEIDKILNNLNTELDSIQGRKAVLGEEFKKNMDSLREQESDMLDEIFDRYDISGYKDNFYAGEPPQNKITQFYEQRETEQPERLEKLKEMVGAQSTNEFAGALMDTATKGYEVGTAIQLVGMLREQLGDQYSVKVLTELANEIHSKENGFTLLKTGLQENYDNAIKALDQQAAKIQDQQKILMEKRTQPTAAQAPTAAPESAKPELPGETPELPSLPTLKPGSGST